MIDKHFNVIRNIDGCSHNPVAAIWATHHVCVSELVDPTLDKKPSRSGMFKAILADVKKGHWSVLRHANAAMSFSGFPHSAAMQWGTHRSLNTLTQSQRYTGQRFLDLYDSIQTSDGYLDALPKINELFYIPAIGSEIISRSGRAGKFTEELCKVETYAIIASVEHFQHLYTLGLPFEQCRDVLAPCYRQAWCTTATYGDWMHALDHRLLADTQDTAREAGWMVLAELEKLCPEIWGWYRENRAGKKKLAP